MPELDHILKNYAEFESEVIAFTSGFLLPWCADCRGGCCQADYCREALDSPFLSLLLSKYRPRATYSTGEGWLTETGCALAAGRPPVCYEFICDRILDAQPTVLYRYGVDILSKLISHVGKRAVSRKHLVAIMDPADLPAIHSDRFERQLAEARQALVAVKFILADKPLPKDAASSLSKITKTPIRQILSGDRVDEFAVSGNCQVVGRAG